MSKNFNQSASATSSGFDLLAPWYDLLLKLPPGNSIKKSQYHFIDQLPYCEKVLIIGEGTGSFLKEILLRKKAGKVWVVDSSPMMARVAKKKLHDLPESEKAKVSFITSSFQEFFLDQKFDLIVTNFFLDLFTEQSVRTMGWKIRGILGSNGIWYFTDFHSQYSDLKYGWLKKKYISFLYFFFRKVTGIEGRRLPDFAKIFKELEMQEIDSKLFAKKLIKTILMKPKHM